MFKKKEKIDPLDTFEQSGHILISCTCGKSRIAFIPTTFNQKIAMCEGCGDILNLEPSDSYEIEDIKDTWNKRMKKKQMRLKRRSNE